MRRLKFICFCLALASWLAGVAHAQGYMPFEFDGQKVMARPISFKDTHIQLALQGGGYTNVPWGRLSQASLQGLMKLKNFSAYAAPFLDPVPQPPPVAPKITVKPVERLDRPTSEGLAASPVMWMVFFLLYVANIYAGYEIAIYRQRHPALVCGLAAVAPVLGPSLFLALPSAVQPQAVEEQEVTEGAEGAEGVVAEAAPVQEAVAEAAPAAAAPEAQVTVYQRGQFTFNRRFFETKLAGFLKLVPGEAEKDMVLAINSTRGNYVGPRLTRVSANELTLHVVKGNASQDVSIPFGEINEVKIRHKDAE
jgi:hypothetical protein